MGADEPPTARNRRWEPSTERPLYAIFMHRRKLSGGMMAQSDEMRLLESKWDSRNAWPKWLEWIQIKNIRGWTGQRIIFDFPIVAIVGENGSGKTTVLQSAACAYRSGDTGRTWYPTEFFPETAWDSSKDVEIQFSFREGIGGSPRTGLVKKPTARWLRQPSRPIRTVYYIGLDRLQPVSTRVGYARIAKTRHTEQSHEEFSAEKLARLSFVMSEDYDFVRMAFSSVDATRQIPVMSKNNKLSSGFHHGMGELTAQEWINRTIDKYSLVIIDELESSLHVRAQRRLMRDLAAIGMSVHNKHTFSYHLGHAAY
jgi:hypothetical protein